MSNTTIMNNSGIDGLDFSGMSLLGKHIKTNLGTSGIVIKEWLCYPEPCEWLLDTGYVLNEAQMYSQNEKILEELENE